MQQRPLLDAVVVGGGPAGLAAATWLGRYRRRTLVVDAGDHRNKLVGTTHGYLTRDGVPPREVLDAARRDLEQYDDVELVAGEVHEVRGSIGGFEVVTDDATHRALRVVLATGVVDELPRVGNVLEHYGESLFHCPSCDGYEGRDRDVVVLGWSEHVVGFALTLLDWSRSITLVTDGHAFEGDAEHRAVLARHGIPVIELGATELVGTRGDLRAVRLADGTELPCQLAFFSIAHHPRNQLAIALGCRTTEEGCVWVDEHGQTSVAGVYAAGDIVPGYQLVQVATAKGTIAGVACATSLRVEPPLPGGPERAPDLDDALPD
jgi:thioredoxin reductase